MMDGDCEIGGGRCMVLTAVLKLRRNLRGFHFFGISGNLEMSGNSAEVREKAQSLGKVREFV